MSRFIDLLGQTTRAPPARLPLAQNRIISGSFFHPPSISSTSPGIGAAAVIAPSGSVTTLTLCPASLVSSISVTPVASDAGDCDLDDAPSSFSKMVDTRFKMIAPCLQEKDPSPKEMSPFAMERSLP